MVPCLAGEHLKFLLGHHIMFCLNFSVSRCIFADTVFALVKNTPLCYYGLKIMLFASVVMLLSEYSDCAHFVLDICYLLFDIFS